MDGTTSNIEQYPQVKLEGRNLGEVETRYFGDMQHLIVNIHEPNSKDKFYALDEENSARIRQIENLFRETQNPTDPTPIKKLEINQDGKVVLQEGQIFHKIRKSQSGNFNNSIMSLISRYGIIASEWFGILESEGEGRFCSFFDTINNNDNNKKMMAGNEIIFTIDYQNPNLQKTLKLDFFRYSRIKTEHPESINEQFSEEELKVLTFINTLSVGGESIFKRHPGWKAIPGGIPARYINGICIDGPGKWVEKYTNTPETYYDDKTRYSFRELSTEDIKRLSEMFPTATIFRRDGKVLHQPQEKQINSDINNNETN